MSSVETEGLNCGTLRSSTSFHWSTDSFIRVYNRLSKRSWTIPLIGFVEKPLSVGIMHLSVRLRLMSLTQDPGSVKQGTPVC